MVMFFTLCPCGKMQSKVHEILLLTSFIIIAAGLFVNGNFPGGFTPRFFRPKIL
jgi:hypothetical protein